MKDLYIEKQARSPQVILNKKTHTFSFTGKSLPEDARSFYNPIFNWFNYYFMSPNLKTVIIFDLDYINTASYKMLLELFMVFKAALVEGFDVELIWYYDEEDEDGKEHGNELGEVANISVILKQKEYFKQ